MQSTEYLSTGPGWDKTKARTLTPEEINRKKREDEMWRLVTQDMPMVVAGNGGRTSSYWSRTDICRYLDELE